MNTREYMNRCVFDVTYPRLTKFIDEIHQKSTKQYNENHPPQEVEFRKSECGSQLPGSLYGKGMVRFACKLSQFSHLQKPGQDQTRKFVGLACAHGADDSFARHNASVLARGLVSQMEIEKARSLGAAPESNEVFVPESSEYECFKLARDGGNVPGYFALR